MGLRTKDIEESITKRVVVNGAQTVEYQPGNGTRYVLHFSAPLTEETRFTGASAGSVIVSELLTRRVVVIAENGFLHWTYLIDKGFTKNSADAIVLAEFIAFMLPHRTAMSCEEAADDFECLRVLG